MTIAIDYDNTWTRDIAFWNIFCVYAKGNGYNVVCITGRTPHHPIHTLPYDIPIHYTEGKAKQLYAESIGLTVDIWIDDDPGSICPSKKLSDIPNDEL